MRTCADLEPGGEGQSLRGHGSQGLVRTSGGGVVAAPIALLARCLSAANALQVTPDSPCPRWVDPKVWRSAAWDLRLALLLLRVKQQAERQLRQWWQRQ